MRLHRPLALLIGIAGTAALAYSCSSKGSTNPPPPHTYTISKFGGDSQVGSAGTTLGAVLVVYVKDERDSSASGQTVTWTAATGGGNVASGTSLTDLDGHATIQRTLGPAAGFQTTTASLSGATGSPITFTSISQIQGAFTIAAGTGSGQSDTVLTQLSAPFQATVTDHLGAPVAGVVVSFNITAGGGSLSQSADTSDGSGHVTTVLTLPSVAGGKTVQAAVTGLIGSPVSFTATAMPGNATQMAKSAGDSQAGVISAALPNPHAVVVKDAHGNAVGSFKVRWVAGTGGGSVSDTAPVTNASGIASTIRTLGSTLGTQTDTASATLTGSPVIFVSTGDSVPALAAVTVGPGISYAPTSVTVSNGGKVTWTWASGSIAHSVNWLTAPGTLPTSSGIQTTGTYQVTFTMPGTYTYDCLVHGEAMTGTVIVRP
ncbi:MAG TPA: plastocyanin/azurin family copper-binding protein [Gemmatimonadales bacterium]|nr:plastocyanin/azurin family copper-binding protein [Gemmatimonadales bacterium]